MLRANLHVRPRCSLARASDVQLEIRRHGVGNQNHLDGGTREAGADTRAHALEFAEQLDAFFGGGVAKGQLGEASSHVEK